VAGSLRQQRENYAVIIKKICEGKLLEVRKLELDANGAIRLRQITADPSEEAGCEMSRQPFTKIAALRVAAAKLRQEGAKDPQIKAAEESLPPQD
jgi:hypothetical protein